MRKLDICQATCWCAYCNSDIKKGEKCLIIYKQARRGVARINICARCIKEFAEEISKRDIQAVENRMVLKELNNGN